ncbi:uncharacterized protein NMK_2815, partial [Novimethylophilus kurashikiensis]
MATETKSVASGTHLTSIGTVKAVVGLVKAVDQNGNERVLQAGDTVFANETIVTAGDGTVLIEFQDGTHLDLPHSAHIVLDADVYAPKENVEQKAEDEAARIEKAIAEGRDPSIVTDAAAAGGTGGDEGSSTPLVIDFNNTQGNVNSGFPTGPVSQTFASAAEILQPTVPTAAPTASVGVTVGVSTGGGDGGGVIILPPGTVVPVGGPSAANIIEGSDGGSRTVTFLITLDQPATTPVTITYTIVPITATNPGDYFDGATTRTITIPAGSPGFTVTENIVQDQYIEANETFKIVLSNPIGVTLANDTATVTIVDDDKAVNDVATVQEGTYLTESGDGVVAAPNTVQGNVLTNDPVSPDETSFVTNPGTYTTALGGTLVLNADGSYTYTAPAHVDNSGPNPVVDTFTYTMGTSGGGASSAQLNITITDTGPVAVNDGPVGVKEDDAQANSVSGNVLTNDSTGADVPVTVNWAASETNISDYGTLTLNKDGTYSFVLDNTKQATQALAEGQQLTYQFTYTVTDADGTTSNPAVLTITINGT